LNIFELSTKLDGMIILFMHRNFPAQFKHIAAELAKDPLNRVIFITANTTVQIPGIIKLVYTPKPKTSKDLHPYLGIYEESVLHGQAAAEIATEIKNRGVIPDVIYGFSWGPSMFIKDVFPDVPYIAYFEWFSKSKDSAYDFGGNILNEDKKIRIRCNNTQIYLDLSSCDAGLSPTHWQKEQFPKEYQDKIKVIHDGVDIEVCNPNKDAKFLIKDKNLELSVKDEVITYATRGMESLRGFPQFMEAVEKLLKKRPKAHFIIGGEDSVFYGAFAPNGMTWKNYMLQKLNLDMNRVHFVGTLNYSEYLSLLQISSAHIYLTYPYVLSWSLLEAMACGCCIIASKTQPVLEVIENNKNGILVDFFSVDHIVNRIEYAIDNPDKMKLVRENARKTVVEKYDKNILVPQHIAFIKSMIKK